MPEASDHWTNNPKYQRWTPERIAKFRAILRMNKAQFSRAVDVSQGTIRRWETAESRPPPGSQRKLDKLLDEEIKKAKKAEAEAEAEAAAED